MTRPPREAYLRGASAVQGYEVHIGLEWRDDDDHRHECWRLRHIALEANKLAPDHRAIVAYAEDAIHHMWPGRAYFVETEEGGVGVQVYQPFGMPRNA